MALSRGRRDRGVDYWPGFVDALSTLLLGIIFLLSIFAVVQFYLSQEVTGKDTALQRLTAQIAQLTDLLALERTGRADLEALLGTVKSNLSATELERDRLRGLAEGAGGAAAAQSRANELATALDLEKQSVARALAQVEILNQQIAALRRPPGAIEEVP
jgi:chemotaxis protein MotB